MKLIKNIWWLGLWALLGAVACTDNDEVGKVDKVSLLDFDFPQGCDPWDREIEQIAKDWNMYIIYKDVDSTHLNRTWTSPIYYDPIYVCTTPSSKDIQIYLALVKEWLLGSLDKTEKEDRRNLPFYLYLVNDLNDGNPRSVTYQNDHIRFKKDGLDYWSLSFTAEELEEGLSPEIIHEVACAFSYPGLKTCFQSGRYKVAPGFADLCDYETPVGRRYYSLEQWQEENPGVPLFIYDMVALQCDKDEQNAYHNRGFASVLGEDFRLEDGEPTYGAPTWMPWIMESFGSSMNPGLVAETVEERVLADFLNMIRVAMSYPEEKVRVMYPVDAESPFEREGHQIIQDKYDLVVEYMEAAYGVDLTKYAGILEK